MGIIPASDIDYKNADEFCGYQLMLCKTIESVGGFDFSKHANEEARALMKEGNVWLRNVKQEIEYLFKSPIGQNVAISLNDIPAILESYDIMHRLCKGAPCSEYLKEIRFRTVERWLKGDKSISPNRLALELFRETHRELRAIDTRYVVFASEIQDKWLKSLKMRGRLLNMPLSDEYRIIRHLINTELYVYYANSQGEVKSKWIKNYALSDEKIDALDTETLCAYIAYITTAEGFLNQDKAGLNTSRLRLFSKLAKRPDLHPFKRKAIEFDLIKYAGAS